MPSSFAKVFSYLFHPLLLPTYAFSLITTINPYLLAGLSPGGVMKLFIMVFVNTFVYPLIFVLLMIKLKFIGNIHMPESKDRHLVYIATSVFFMWSYLVFRKQQMPEVLVVVFLGASIGVLAAFFINIFHKISMHTIGMGALVALIFGLAAHMEYNLWIPLTGVILLAGLVGSARMKISTHRPGEIYSGYLVGIFCQVMAFIFV